MTARKARMAMPIGAKPVNGYEEKYAVTPDGVIWSMLSHRPLQQSVCPRGKGYLQVSLWNDNKGKLHYVHQLVAKAFVPNPNGLPTVNHDDGNTRNNVHTNLIWATHQEQVDHAWNNGLSKHFGENGTNVTLTEEAVRLVPDYLAAGFTQRETGEILGVSQSQISRIANGKRWVRALKEQACK